MGTDRTSTVSKTRQLALGAALSATVLLFQGSPTAALYHISHIDEVLTSYDGDPSVQFVEIRMEADLQRFVLNSVLGAFDAEGDFLGDVLIVPANVPRAGAGVSWLMATRPFADLTGLTPDFLIPADLPTGGGMICWGGPGIAAPPPESWDHADPERYVDCVAYGSYRGPTNSRIGNPTPFDPDGHGLQRGSDTGNNAADFACADPAMPENNAGQSVSLAATSSCDGAGPPICPGDCNFDSRVAIDELVRGVNIAVDLAPVAACVLLDIDRDGQITIDELIAAVAAALEGCQPPPRIVSVDIDILSGAAAPNTPGTPGVVVTNEKLITQFRGTTFNLNVPRYVRFRLDEPDLAPDAIFIVVPGFNQGASHFRTLAENLIRRLFLTRGFALELWAFDRRSNQLEDREGGRLAEQLRDPLLALDWYYGGELGLALDPRLTRRAIFYNDSDDVPFLANWTTLIHSRDIDVVVGAARAAARNANVFLGGFSGGAAFTARYAATNFNLSGAGPAEPGYEKLRGLVLLDGAGGPTAGSPVVPPPSPDDLDLVIAKADGGLFSAVRDREPRCVDGSPCEEDADCAGVQLPAGALSNKCVQPTRAYTLLLDLQPSFFASADIEAIQSLTDPDGGQVILQADQGAPGNNAIAKVPALSALGAIPPSTVQGFFGTFVDDDGPAAAVTGGELAFSLGAPGPVVDGLLTWRDITEGPPPASAVPDHGPPPTTLPPPGTRVQWGQEKEVIRIDRVLLALLGVNGGDWYYSAGLGVTEGLGLDTTPLSVGRGRPDIENLTQAANVDIPVICFGGSNGLVPLPGSYLDIAGIIGACAAPTCDGTPRVVDPDSPSPAFPTFGGVAGGFEVHISEGFAHGDIIFAEDGEDNNVLAPLAEFLVRNSAAGE